MNIEQAKTPLYEKPKFTVEEVSTKMAALDRELKYLINKMKSFKPKSKPKPMKSTNSTEGSNSSESKSADGELSALNSSSNNLKFKKKIVSLL